MAVAKDVISPGRTLPFACLGSDCPNTCCGPFHGTRALQAALSHGDLGNVLRGAGDPPERGQLEVSLFALIRLLEVDVKRLQDAGLDHLIVRRGAADQPAYYLKLEPDGTCSALRSDKLCSIHSHRPTLCRAFPFYFDLFAGLSLVASCPGVNAGETPVEELQGEVEAAKAMYQFWLDSTRAVDDEPE